MKNQTTNIERRELISEIQEDLAEQRKAAIATLPVATDDEYQQLVAEYKTSGKTPAWLNSLAVEDDGEGNPLLDELGDAVPYGRQLNESQKEHFKKLRKDREEYLATSDGRSYVDGIIGNMTCTRFSTGVRQDGRATATASFVAIDKGGKKKSKLKVARR